MYSISYNYMIIKLFFFSLEPAGKRSCQPIGNTALTDMQTTKSTAEQPRSPTVHIQQLEAEHSASPGQSLTDNLHITEPFQPTNFNFPKKTFGKQHRSFQSKWFNDSPWLHYNKQRDSVLCFICAQQNEKLNLRAARNKEWVFISQGFSNWKKALVRFKEHQVSECHKLAMEYQISIPNTCGNVIQMSNDAAKKTMATNRFCLLKIIECLQYLARQAMPMQGDTDEESNFIQLLKLRGKDQPVLLKWLERKDDKYTSHEIQNQIISIMANNVIRDLVADIRGGFLQLNCRRRIYRCK